MNGLKKFFLFLIQNPKVVVSTIAVLVIQLAKMFGLAFDLAPELLDAITAFIGLIGLIFAAQATWPSDTPDQKPEDKKT